MNIPNGFQQKHIHLKYLVIVETSMFVCISVVNYFKQTKKTKTIRIKKQRLMIKKSLTLAMSYDTKEHHVSICVIAAYGINTIST